MDFDPSTAELVKTEFDPSTAELVQQETAPLPVQEESTLSKIANSKAVEKVNALGGGIATGLADTASYALQGKESNLPLPEHVQQAEENNPYTSLGGKVTGAVGGAIAATQAASTITSPIIQSALSSLGKQEILGLSAGVLNNIAANTIAGSILSGPGNRALGAGLGTVAGAAGEMLGMAVSKTTSIATVTSKTKETVAEISSKIKSNPGSIAAQDQANMWNQSNANSIKLFDDFRSVPGKVSTDDISTTAVKFLSKHVDELTPPQKNAITSLIDNAINAKNIADLHDARKLLSYDFPKFTVGRPLSGMANNDFRALKSVVDNSMKTNAEVLGVGKEYSIANNYYQNTILPMINSGAKDTAEALTPQAIATDPMLGSKIIDTSLKKFINVNKPEEAKVWLNTLSPVGKQAAEIFSIQNALKTATQPNGTIDLLSFKEQIGNIKSTLPELFSENSIKLLTGLNRVVDEATIVAGIPFDVAKINPITKVSLPIGTGVTIGGLIGGGISGALAGGAIAYTLTSLINSKIGQSLLIKASSEGGKEIAKAIGGAALLQSILKYGDNYKNSPPGQ